jgi:O-antigen/teichoic acid export membrane protein
MNDSSKKHTPFYFQEALIFSALSFVGTFLTFLTQAVFSRTLATGEFGTLSSALGLVLLLGVPLSAINQTLIHHLARFHAADQHDETERMHLLTSAILKITALATGVAALIVIVIFPRVFFPFRPLLQGAVLLTALTVLASSLSGALCLGLSRFRLWGSLIIAAALLRFLLAITLTSRYPRAEMALAITAVAGLVTSAPICWRKYRDRTKVNAGSILAQKDFLIYMAASFSVMLALFLFTSGDQIVAQYCFGPKASGHDPSAASLFDSYQAAGLLGRALLWGTAPILAVMFTHVSREPFLSPQPNTPVLLAAGEKGPHRRKALQLLFLYSGTLIAAAVLLQVLRETLTSWFLGHASAPVADLILRFIIAMIPLGMLQAVGILCLATKAFADCLVIGVGAVVYIILLKFLGNSPENMLHSMFYGGGGLILIMALLRLTRRLFSAGSI